jgi:hypothetical protein
MSKRNKPMYAKRIPEYQSRNLDVPTAGKSLLHDQFGMPKLNKNTANQRKVVAKEQITNNPISIKATLDAEKDVSFYGDGKTQRAAIPPMVSIGRNNETMWFDEGSVAVPVGKQEAIDNNENIDIEALQGHDNLNSPFSTGNIPHPYHQEPVYQQSEPVYQQQDSTVQQQEQEPQDENSLEPGQYAVLYDNEIIVKGHNITEIKGAIEEMILKYNVPIEQIVLIKRLPIDFGLLVEEN